MRNEEIFDAAGELSKLERMEIRERMVANLANVNAELSRRVAAILGLTALRSALADAGATVFVLAPHGGSIKGKTGSLAVDQMLLSTRSVEYDALILAGGSAKVFAGDANLAENFGEAYRHHKTVGAWGGGRAVLEELGIPAGAPGVVSGASVSAAFGSKGHQALGWHRHWDR